MLICAAPKVTFLRYLGLKTGIHFTRFRLESGMVFVEATGVYEVNVFVVSI